MWLKSRNFEQTMVFFHQSDSAAHGLVRAAAADALLWPTHELPSSASYSSTHAAHSSTSRPMDSPMQTLVAAAGAGGGATAATAAEAAAGGAPSVAAMVICAHCDQT